jgi:Heterokaryon incompatibility protein (HET)
MSGSGDVYKKIPLSLSLEQIRLIRLKRSIYGEITCEVEVHKLLECPPFIALSYTWGPSKPSRAILVQDYPKAIGENLWCAFDMILRHWELARNRCKEGAKSVQPVADPPGSYPEIRNVFEHLAKGTKQNLRQLAPLFWVDQISINQENVKEKSQQVGLMRRIYSTATFVLTWLGRDADGSEYVLRHMAGKNSSSPNFGEKNFWFLESMVRRAYWRRLWIIQEVVAAKELLIMCGLQVVLLDEFRETVSKLPWRREGEDFMDSAGVYLLDKLRYQFNEKTEFTTLQLIGYLLHFKRCGCSDPRDRVFGVKDLLRGTGLDRVEVDYGLSREDLLIRCLTALAHSEPFEDFGENYLDVLIEALELDGSSVEVKKVLGMIKSGKLKTQIDGVAVGEERERRRKSSA